MKEKLSDLDISSFDISASQFVQHLGNLYKTWILLKKQSGKKHESMNAIGEWGAEDAAITEAAGGGDSIFSIEEEILGIIQDLNWTAKTCDGRTISLVSGGSTKCVTLENLGLYLKSYVQCRLFEFFPAVDAFRQGVWSVLPESSLGLFTWEELEHIVCGSRKIDIERLKSNTEYDDDISALDAHIIAFWEVLHEFSEIEKSSFLKFVWARPTLPPIGVEFPQKMKVQTAVGDEASLKPDQYLPKAHTCFFSLNLPNYSSKELLAEKLRYAITQCTEMDADFRLTDSDVAGWSTSPSQPWNASSTILN